VRIAETPNANSFLYGRMARIARLMGYRKIVTYTLAEERGASLKAVGAKVVGEVRPQEWSVPSRPRRSQPVYTGAVRLPPVSKTVRGVCNQAQLLTEETELHCLGYRAEMRGEGTGRRDTV
jgi:hypothetical protein